MGGGGGGGSRKFLIDYHNRKTARGRQGEKIWDGLGGWTGVQDGLMAVWEGGGWGSRKFLIDYHNRKTARGRQREKIWGGARRMDRWRQRDRPDCDT